MIDQLIEWDREIFLFLNGQHSEATDLFMYALTNTWAWIPLYILLLYWIWKYYGSNSWIFLLGIAVTVLIADRVTSGLMKPWFLRLRPSHEPALERLVHTVSGYKGGKYGFASSHAANTMGVALFMFLLLKQKVRLIWLIFTWAVFIAYTRIYLGVHYPGDLIAGWIVGGAAGLGCHALARRMYDRKSTAGL